jgi:hypothetical protein
MIAKQIEFTDSIEFWISGVPVIMELTYWGINYRFAGPTHFIILN